MNLRPRKPLVHLALLASLIALSISIYPKLTFAHGTADQVTANNLKFDAAIAKTLETFKACKTYADLRTHLKSLEQDKWSKFFDEKLKPIENQKCAKLSRDGANGLVVEVDRIQIRLRFDPENESFVSVNNHLIKYDPKAEPEVFWQAIQNSIPKLASRNLFNFFFLPSAQADIGMFFVRGVPPGLAAQMVLNGFNSNPSTLPPRSTSTTPDCSKKTYEPKLCQEAYDKLTSRYHTTREISVQLDSLIPKYDLQRDVARKCPLPEQVQQCLRSLHTLHKRDYERILGLPPEKASGGHILSEGRSE